MSVYSQARAVADTTARANGGARGAADDADDAGANPTPFQRFSRYIPGDVVGLYLFGFGVMASQKNDSTPSGTEFASWSFLELTWLNFWVILALIPLWVFVAFWLATPGTFRDVVGRAKHLWWAVGSGIVAYTCWTIAIPETPFSDLRFYNETVASTIAVGGSGFLLWAEKIAKRIDPLSAK